MGPWRAQPNSDIVAVGVQLLRSRVRLLSGMLRAGLVKAEVRTYALGTQRTYMLDGAPTSMVMQIINVMLGHAFN